MRYGEGRFLKCTDTYGDSHFDQQTKADKPGDDGEEGGSNKGDRSR